MIYILCVVLLNSLVCTFTSAVKSKSVHLNLETVLEFDNKNLEKDVRILDNVQTFLTKVRRVLDKSNDYRRSYDKEKIKFTDFLENILALIVTFNDDELEELAVVIDEELRKYHYKGCKFYELVKNEEVRNYIGDALEELRQMPARKMRKLLKRCLKKLQNREFSKNDAEFVKYVNSLYRAEAKEKMHNVLKTFEEFNRTRRRAHVDMVQVVQNGIRAIIFDHYSNLNPNTRKDFRLKIGNFVTLSSGKNHKINRAHTMLTDAEDEDKSKIEQSIDQGEKRKKISTTDTTVKRKYSSEENKDGTIAEIPMFTDVKFISETTTKNMKQNGQKIARDQTSSSEVTVKYELSSEKDKVTKRRSDFYTLGIIDDTTTKSIKRERKSVREKTTPHNPKKNRSKKGKHEKKESVHSDVQDTGVTTPKHIKRKRHKSSHIKNKTTDSTPKWIYSTEDNKHKEKESMSDVDSDDETKTKISKSSTKKMSLEPYRDLDEEKNSMPLRFLSLFTETIPTTTPKLRSKKHHKLKTHKRIKHARMRTETEEKAKSSKLKKHKQGKLNELETMMVVTEDRPLRDILTEHNAIIKAETPKLPTENIVEKNKENHHKREHGRMLKPKHSSHKNSKLHDTPQLFEMSPASSGSDESEKRLRKHFSVSGGLPIESFENNVLDGHYLYRKKNNNDGFRKRSDLRKEAKQQKQAKQFKNAVSVTDNDDETTQTHGKQHKYQLDESDGIQIDSKEFEKTDKPTFRGQSEEIVTTNSFLVSDDYIISKIHNLEKQLESVINKMNDTTETEKNMTKDGNTNSTIVIDNVSPLIVVNRDKIYENIETTPEMAIIPFWQGTLKTTRVVVSSSSSEKENESDNETVFNPKMKNNKTDLSSPTVVKTKNTDRVSTTASIMTTTVAEVTGSIPSKNITSSKSRNKSKTTLKNTISSTTKDILRNGPIEEIFEDDYDLHDGNNVTIVKRTNSSKDNENIFSKEDEIKDKTFTKKDGRKVNKAVTLTAPKKFKSNYAKFNEVKRKTTSKNTMPANNENEKNNNTITVTGKVTNTKTTPTIEVTTKMTSTASVNKSNVTLTTEIKTRSDLNKTKSIKDTEPMDKTKTNNSAVVTKMDDLNNTSPSSTTFTVLEISTDQISNADNKTKAIPKQRRKLDYKSPNDMDEEGWEKNRQSNDLLYSWA